MRLLRDKVDLMRRKDQKEKKRKNEKQLFGECQMEGKDKDCSMGVGRSSFA